MRIGCAGSSGTGKTTIARWLADALGCEVCPVGSRSVAKAMGYFDARGEGEPYAAHRAGAQREFQARILAEKCAWEGAHERFVTDRTTLDNVAYMALHDVASVTAEALAAAAAGMLRYDRVIYFPASVFIRIDGQDFIRGAPAGARTEPGADAAARMGGANNPMPLEDARAYHETFDALLYGLLMRHRPDMIVMAVPDLEGRKGMLRSQLRLAGRG